MNMQLFHADKERLNDAYRVGFAEGVLWMLHNTMATHDFLRGLMELWEQEDGSGITAQFGLDVGEEAAKIFDWCSGPAGDVQRHMDKADPDAIAAIDPPWPEKVE